MVDGRVICSGNASDLLKCIFQYGFSKCIKEGGRFAMRVE